MRGHPLDPCQVRAFHHVPCNNRALSAAICGCLAAPVMIYRFSRYSAYPCLRGLFNKERGRLLCVGDVRSPLPLSFHSRYKGCISGNGASAQSVKEPAPAAGKCENEGRRGRLRPHGRTWELGSLTIFRNLAQLPRLTLSPRPGAALLGTHGPCPWLPGLAERLLSGGPTRGTRLGLRQVQAPVRAGGEGQSGHRAHLLQPRGLCGGDTDADAEESRERCPEGQRVQGENGCIPEVSGRPGQRQLWKPPDPTRDLAWRSEGRDAEAEQSFWAQSLARPERQSMGSALARGSEPVSLPVGGFPPSWGLGSRTPQPGGWPGNQCSLLPAGVSLWGAGTQQAAWHPALSLPKPHQLFSHAVAISIQYD